MMPLKMQVTPKDFFSGCPFGTGRAYLPQKNKAIW